jgi:integrase
MVGAASDQLCLFDFGLGGVDMERVRAVRERWANNGRSPATKRAYAADLRDFRGWCEAVGRSAVPASAETLALYVAGALDVGRAPATVGRRLAAIAVQHRADGVVVDQSEARQVLRGARRERGSATSGKLALQVEDLRRICRGLPGTPGGVRDAALLLLGFASGCRRSELADLDLSDVVFAGRKGLRLTIRRSKTDQEGVGRVVGIFRGRNEATCPVRALRAWLRVRRDWPGCLFCRVTAEGEVTGDAIGGDAVGQVVKRAVALIGLDPSRYGGHSLRAGCVTAAAAAGVPESLIMQRTGHKSIQMVSRYVRPASVFALDLLEGCL